MGTIAKNALSLPPLSLPEKIASTSASVLPPTATTPTTTKPSAPTVVSLRLKPSFYHRLVKEEIKPKAAYGGPPKKKEIVKQYKPKQKIVATIPQHVPVVRSTPPTATMERTKPTATTGISTIPKQSFYHRLLKEETKPQFTKGGPRAKKKEETVAKQYKHKEKFENQHKLKEVYQLLQKRKEVPLKKHKDDFKKHKDDSKRHTDNVRKYQDESKQHKENDHFKKQKEKDLEDNVDVIRDIGEYLDDSSSSDYSSVRRNDKQTMKKKDDLKCKKDQAKKKRICMWFRKKRNRTRFTFGILAAIFVIIIITTIFLVATEGGRRLGK